MIGAAHLTEHASDSLSRDLIVRKRFERRLFGGPRAVATTVELKSSSPFPLGELFIALCDKGLFQTTPILTSRPIIAPRELVNMRGRPLETFESLADAPPESEEEILFVRGKFLHNTSDADKVESDVNEEEGEGGFTYSLRTKFSRFIGSRQIVYQLDRCIFPPDTLPFVDAAPADIGSMSTLQLTELRIGFELFVSRSVGMFLGLAPIINVRFYLDASETSLRLFVEGEEREGIPGALEEEIKLISEFLAARRFYPGLLEAIR